MSSARGPTRPRQGSRAQESVSRSPSACGRCCVGRMQDRTKGLTRDTLHDSRAGDIRIKYGSRRLQAQEQQGRRRRRRYCKWCDPTAPIRPRYRGAGRRLWCGRRPRPHDRIATLGIARTSGPPLMSGRACRRKGRQSPFARKARRPLSPSDPSARVPERRVPAQDETQRSRPRRMARLLLGESGSERTSVAGSRCSSRAVVCGAPVYVLASLRKRR